MGSWVKNLGVQRANLGVLGANLGSWLQAGGVLGAILGSWGATRLSGVSLGGSWGPAWGGPVGWGQDTPSRPSSCPSHCVPSEGRGQGCPQQGGWEVPKEPEGAQGVPGGGHSKGVPKASPMCPVGSRCPQGHLDVPKGARISPRGPNVPRGLRRSPRSSGCPHRGQDVPKGVTMSPRGSGRARRGQEVPEGLGWSPKGVSASPRGSGGLRGVTVSPKGLGMCPKAPGGPRGGSQPPPRPTLSMKEANLLLSVLICSFSSFRTRWMLGSISRLRGVSRLWLTLTAVMPPPVPGATAGPRYSPAP